MDKESVELEDVSRVFQGHYAVDRFQLRIRQFDGEWSESFKRELFRTGPAVVVVLFDPHRDQLVMIEQFRIAAYAENRPCWMLEYVAGKIAPDDDPEAAARRETSEEADCEIIRLERACEYFISPGNADELLTLYVGQIDSSKVGGVFGLKEEHENIRVHVKPVGEVLAMADAGTLLNVNTHFATLWFARHREALMEKWI